MDLKDFVKVSAIPDETINKYQNRVCPEVVDMWKEYGTGSFLGGYLRIINPDDYDELIEETYFSGKNNVPLFVTAFGDVITYEKEGYIFIIEYKKCDFDCMIKDFSLFIRLLDDPSFCEEYYNFILYEKAKEKFGELALDESYGFVPLLPLGGKKDVNHMDKVKTREHIELISQLVGKVGMD